MKSISKIFSLKLNLLIVFFIGGLIACNKDYITGGQPNDVNKYKNTTTFDYLTTAQPFDTLVQLIEAGNLQDEINQTGTFFAVTNSAIYSYLNAKTIHLQNTVDVNAKFTLDSLKYYIQNNINGTKDSLLMYLIPGMVLTPDLLTQNGVVYPSGLKNNNVAVSYEQTKDENSGYYGSVSSIPQLVYFTQLWQPYAIDENNPIADVPTGIGVHTSVISSFINTKSGVVNVLSPGQSLFFYGTH